VCGDIVGFSSSALTAEEFAEGIFNHEDYTNNPNNANDKVFPGLEKCRLHDCALRLISVQ